MSATEQPADAGSVMDRLAAKFEDPSDREEQAQEDGGPLNPPEASASEQEEEAAAAEASAPEYEEVDIDGVTVAVPKEQAQKVIEANLRWADYTKKTQETAERARLVEAREQQAALAQAFQQQYGQKLQEFNQVASDLRRYESLNLRELSVEDRSLALAELQTLASRESRLKEELTQAQSALTSQFEQARQGALDAVIQRLQRTIGWNDQIDNDLNAYAQQHGITREKAINLILAEPSVAEWAYKASQYDKLQADKTAAVKQAVKAPPLVKPGTTRPMPAEVKDKLNFRKQMASAKTSSEKAKLIEAKLAGMYR